MGSTPIRVLAIAALLAACGSPDARQTPEPQPQPQPQPEPQPQAQPEPPTSETCANAPTWRFERIEFPPEFAPTLPAGVEKLYFAPGMFKPGEPDYWSYVFSIEIAEAISNDAESVQKFLDTYYVGLIKAVAAAKKHKTPSPAAGVVVEKLPSGYGAVIKTIDAFTGGQPIEVTLDIRVSPDAKCINVAASAAPRKMTVWKQLETARSCVPCP